MSAISKAFKKLNLSPSIEKAIESLGYKEPTEVQTQAIPAALQGLDLVVRAETGTGKTAAFCFPIMEKLLKSENKKALILVPTREIGVQIDEFIKEISKDNSEIRTALLIGGVALKKQEKALASNPRVLIASPGRLVDLIERKSVHLKDISLLVIDEADRLLDMGFTPQLNEIVNQVSPKRQSMLFSATINHETQILAKAYTKKAHYIDVTSSKAKNLKLETLSLDTNAEMKFDNLLDELNSRQGSVIIFAKTKLEVEHLFDELSAYAYPVKRIHGDRTQSQRNSAVRSLKEGETRVLVATDVAARGLDIPAIEYVFNYDPPQMPDDYTHRIGRTARAGTSGQVLNFVTPENKEDWAITLDPNRQPNKNKPSTRSKKKTNFKYRSKKNRS